MRVIAGTYKGRRLLQPKDRSVRPTSDRVKEALFSILGDRIRQARFVDLYAGSGAIGIEALSRGAAQVEFVESHRPSLDLLHANLQRLGPMEHAVVHACSAQAYLQQLHARHGELDIAFADPPYAQTEALLPSLGRDAIIGANSVVILEHATKTALPSRLGQLHLRRRYRYGDTSLSVFVASPEGSSSE
jgi:16S rRNA (guanine966-N2)-methyltransferase